MSDNKDQSSGQSTALVSDQAPKENDSVAYQTYRKAVGENKKLKEMLDSVISEREQEKQAVLIEQNKYKDLFEKASKDLKAKEEEAKTKEKLFIKQNLKNTVAQYAKDLGAKPEALDEIYAVGEAKALWNQVEVKDDYTVNADHVKKSLEEMSQKSPWFFVKQANPPKDVVMGSNGTQAITVRDLTKLSMEQLSDLAKTLK